MSLWIGSGNIDPQLTDREILDKYQQACEDYYSVCFERDILKRENEELMSTIAQLRGQTCSNSASATP